MNKQGQEQDEEEEDNGRKKRDLFLDAVVVFK